MIIKFKYSFILILITSFIIAAPGFAKKISQTKIDLLKKNVKIKHPDIIFDDFIEGKEVTRVIVNLDEADISVNITDIRIRENIFKKKDRILKEKLINSVAGYQNEIIRRIRSKKFKVLKKFLFTPSFSAEVSLDALRELIEFSRVVSIEKDHPGEFHTPQGIPLMNADNIRNSYGGSGVSIAICDTGVDYTHPKLGNSTFPNSKVIGGYDTGDDDADPVDSYGHGTSCAGIAAGNLSTGNYLGGIAPGAKIYALKFSQGTGGDSYVSDLTAAWEWCIAHQDDDPNNPIMIISTSWGGGSYSSTCDTVIRALSRTAKNAVSAGITLFISSGNDGYCSSIAFPACISDAISVGAVYDADFGTYQPCISELSCAPKTSTTQCTGWYAIDLTNEDMVTSYSNTAAILDILAPGNKCFTTDIVGSSGYSSGDYYSGFGGTSAASPYAAGAAACLQSYSLSVLGRFLTPAEVKSILTGTGDPLTDGKVSITKPRVNLENAAREIGLITVDIPFGAAEGDGALTNQGTVTIPFTSSTDTDITIASGDMTEVTVPSAVITIPAGLTSATFDVTVEDDGECDGDQTSTVTASATDFFDGTDSIIISDNDSALCDFDEDGLTDVLEAEMCTDPNEPDTDNDLLLDGEEDANKNGTVDVDETDPCDSDTDNDGMPDGWEVGNSLDPLVDDAFEDSDLDTYSNFREYLSGTDPWSVLDIPVCDFDFYSDSDVDGSDLNVIAREFGRNDCTPGDPCESDLNGDGIVDNTDLNFFYEDFGRDNCP